MGINSNQDDDPNYRGYGGYGGAPRKPYNAEDPYGANQQSSTQGSTQQQQYSGEQQQYSGGQQQQQYYQPPQSATSRSSGGTYGATSTNLDAKTEALLSYLFGWVGGLVFLLIERKNRFVRFAAAQSIVLTGPVFLVYVVLQLIAGIPVIGFLANCLTVILVVPTGLIWLFLMVQTYRGMETKLPIISDYAEVLLSRFFPQRKTM